ncbi:MULTISPECIES: chemotaxis protein CheW [Marinomonas]|uniref:Purine-binding chemotaxis protein CheW n=1 Tax=Marinomonas alcarazii TaxID=491949 RepID=A0A318UZF4_9GAMM|nr:MULTISPECIES: chemotaxis protein CheW [Marinomonas]PYF81774.1 purine-binding chemotaxis protein CheW [Marinomonas alcarazii]
MATTSIALKSANQSEDPMLQWVTFRLENEIYGVNVMQVKEVLRYSEIAPVPGAPNFVLGIIHLRGTVVTVIDTCQRFGLPSGEITDATRIMILEVEGHVIGILVDAVSEVVYLRQSEIEPSPNVGNDESSKFIQGVCHKNDILLILVDLDKLLSENEWSEVGSM